jgi:hypothetical protein
MPTPKTIEQRTEEFVAVFGGVPRGARKLEDYEAKQHQDIWIQRLVGEGVCCHYVVGYQLDDEWWTFCFDRRDDDAADDSEEEVWVVEAYNSAGGSWRDAFLYSPFSGQWRRGPAELPAAGRDPGKRTWT